MLQTFFYCKNTLKLSIEQSAELTVKEIIIFWGKARIETKRVDHCVEKLLKLHNEWRDLKKLANRSSELEKKKRETFSKNLDMLFDIAHETALNKLKDDDKQFYLNQRSENREGCLLGIDQKQTKKEQRRVERLEKEQQRKRRYIQNQELGKKNLICKTILPSCAQFY